MNEEGDYSGEYEREISTEDSKAPVVMWSDDEEERKDVRPPAIYSGHDGLGGKGSPPQTQYQADFRWPVQGV